jgi:hypothetical protein
VNGWSRSTVPKWWRVEDACECGSEPSSALLFHDIIIIIFSGSAAQRGLWPPRITRFLVHTQRRATVGRTPLDE